MKQRINPHQHHVSALVRNWTVASGTGYLAGRDVLCLLVLCSVEGELFGAAGEEDVVLGDDDGPWRITDYFSKLVWRYRVSRDSQ
jgi:hypothetical protein